MKWKFGKFSFKKNTLRATFGKQKFDYDVSDLGEYVDEQSDVVMSDLIEGGRIKSRINIMPNVKGKEAIKIINSEPSLQSAADCGLTPEGGMILTDKVISTVRVKIEETYCNENLNETWAQIMNAVGANAQDETPPTFAAAMLVYYQERANQLDENLIINGDTASLDSNLVYYDGFKKLWFEDGEVNVVYSAKTAITAANGFDALKELYNGAPTRVKSYNEMLGAEIICGFEVAQFCLDQIYADKDYASSIDVERTDGEITFILPTTNMRVRSIVQLNGTQDAYLVPHKYMFYGTDLENDMDGFTWKYNDYLEELLFSVKWRSGVQYIFPSNFTRLRLTATS